MNSDTLKMISELYSSESSKLMICDSQLDIVYTNCPLLFGDLTKLTQDMFSRSNVIHDSEGLLPISEKTVLSLIHGGISYIAIVRPYCEEGSLFYIIELLDSTDFSVIELHSQSSLSEFYRLSKLREAAALIYSAQTAMSERALREEFECPTEMRMFEKSCYMVLSASANKNELQNYCQDIHNRLPVDISILTEEICAICSAYLIRENISLKYDIEEGVAAVISCDRYVIALLNLFVNAAMYNISEKKKISLSLRRSGSEVRITVKDNGIGMALDDIEKAFVPYALCNAKSSGGGLGLPIVNLFARSCCGSASIVSKPDNGTYVTIRLPAYEGDLGNLHMPDRLYAGDCFSPVNVYLSQIKYDCI